MEKRNRMFNFILLSAAIISLLIVININNKNGYYVGEILSIDKNDNLSTLLLSPIESDSDFILELKANHKIEYYEDTTLTKTNLKYKDREGVYLKQLDNTIDDLKIGDCIIFKVNKYNKNSYKLKVYEIAVSV